MKLQIDKKAIQKVIGSDSDILNVQQTRELLGIGRVSVYHLIESGQLSAFHMGRSYKIPKNEIIRFLKNLQEEEK